MHDTLVADAGFGSEENYEYPENNNVEAFAKYQYFNKGQSKKWRTDPYRTGNLPYDEKSDSYSCRLGQQIYFIRAKIKIIDDGFKQTKRLSQAKNCRKFLLRGLEKIEIEVGLLALKHRILNHNKNSIKKPSQ